MNVLNLLEFLNSVKTLNTLSYAKWDSKLVNFLTLMTEDAQFTRRIDFGVMYMRCTTLDTYVVIDGINRLLSLSLLLHAICECYKKTTKRNDKAIRTIRTKYLLNGTRTKLRLPEGEQEIYEKIVYGERLSEKEKRNPMFVLLHNFWSQIKEERLQASNIFKMLQKIRVMIADTDEAPLRDLYYSLNREKRKLNQLGMIEDYLKEHKIKDEWGRLLDVYKNKIGDVNLFFKDYFVTKFGFKVYDEERLYEMFINYFDTMLLYQKPKEVMSSILKTAGLYSDILNVNFTDEGIRNSFIRIKMYDGEDTYAYLLSIYEDYIDGNITTGTFGEILSTITEYLKARKNNPGDVGFNDLIRYLNAYITCK